MQAAQKDTSFCHVFRAKNVWSCRFTNASQMIGSVRSCQDESAHSQVRAQRLVVHEHAPVNWHKRLISTGRLLPFSLGDATWTAAESGTRARDPNDREQCIFRIKRATLSPPPKGGQKMAADANKIENNISCPLVLSCFRRPSLSCVRPIHSVCFHLLLLVPALPVPTFGVCPRHVESRRQKTRQ